MVKADTSAQQPAKGGDEPLLQAKNASAPAFDHDAFGKWLAARPQAQEIERQAEDLLRSIGVKTRVRLADAGDMSRFFGDEQDANGFTLPSGTDRGPVIVDARFGQVRHRRSTSCAGAGVE